MNVVYADVYFFINFCLDFLVLISCGKILFKKIKLSFVFLSSAIGAIYSVFALVLNLKGIFGILINLLISFLMIYIPFEYSSFANFLKSVLIFYAISILFGGGINAFHTILANAVSRFNLTHKNIPPFTVLSLSFAVFIFLIFAGRMIFQNQSIKTAKIQMILNNKIRSLTLLCDSGNLLRDPYSGLPVIVLKSKIMSEIFEMDFNLICSNNLIFENESNFKDLKIRFIPICTATGDQMLCAFKPNEIVIFENDKKIHIEAIVASDSGNSQYNGLDGILPSVLCQNF